MFKTVWAKVWLMVTVLIGIIGASGFYVYQESKAIEKQYLVELEEMDQTLEVAQGLNLNILQVKQWLTNISATRGEEGFNSGFEEAEKYYHQSLKLMNQMKQMKMMSEEEFLTLSNSFKEFYKVGVDMSWLYIKNGSLAGNAMMTSFNSLDTQLHQSIGAIISKVEKDQEQSILAMRKHVERVNFVMILSYCLIGLFSFTSLVWFGRNFASQLNGVIRKLSHEVHSLLQTSEEASYSSTELSKVTQDQASGLQETVSSIDEISSMVQKNADSAKFSTEASMKSSQAVATGKRTVEDMISSITDISSSNDEMMGAFQKNNDDISKIVELISEIGEKTNVINDIVFQTKLLSFNASVEAARAGEHGKGFAVVAEEVGNLASMSGKAALEISEMLESSSKQVKTIVEQTKGQVDSLMRLSKEKIDKGTATAKDCGDALDVILENVSSVNEMVKEIATASEEQAIGVQEVTKAMQLLDQSTSHSTVLSKKSHDMSISLKGQSEKINLVIDELSEFVSSSNKVEPEHFDQDPPSSNGKDSQNILDFKKAEPKVEEKVQTVPQAKKVANDSVELPSHDDPRFEEV